MTSQPVVELARGLGFTEGPLWLDDGRLLVVSVSRGLLFEIIDGEARELVEVGGNPTGLCRDTGGDIWIAQGGGHARTSSTRETTACIQRLRGAALKDFPARDLNGPNDLVLGPDGLIWFTDPSGEAMASTGAPGGLWTMDRESGELSLRVGKLRFPNGLAFDPRSGDLCVAETGRARIRRFGVEGGEVIPRGVHCELAQGHPDGIAFDQEGCLHVATPDAGAVISFDPHGRQVGAVELGERTWPTNLCFGGPGLRTLFVTLAAGGRVVALPAPTPGAPLPA